MHITMIGGLDRNERLLRDLAHSQGHSLEMHSGRMCGRGALELRALVERSDFVILTPDVNSHGAVQLGKKLAREQKRPWVILRTCGVARFRTLLEGLAIQHRAA